MDNLILHLQVEMHKLLWHETCPSRVGHMNPSPLTRIVPPSCNCRWHEASRQVLGTLLAQLFFQLCDALGHRRLLLILNQKLVDLIMLHIDLYILLLVQYVQVMYVFLNMNFHSTINPVSEPTI